ncbi:MAG: FAD:protein FMN transferase [Spirochaetota bacterium]
MSNKHINNKSSLLMILTFALILTFSVNFISCSGTEWKMRSTGSRYIEGLKTFVKFTAYTSSEKEFEEYRELIQNIIDNNAPIVSIYISGGEANRINKKAGKEEIKLSDEMESLIKKCLHYSKLTDGAFDITIKPVFDLWQIKERTEKYINDNDSKLDYPSAKEIKEKLELVGYEKIRLKEGKISFTKEGVQILLGGVAKGYILDKIRRALIDKGLKSGILEAGGDIIIFGNKPEGDLWKIGLRNPRPDSESLGHIKNYKSVIYGLEIEAKTVVTSGDYEQYYVDKEGNLRHHIIDPETGYPAEPVISATVTADSVIDADILSTAIFVMGPDKGTKLIETMPGIESLIIYRQGEGDNYRIRKSSGFDKYIAVRPEK